MIPRPFLNGTLKETFERYPHIGALLPAMGYSRRQIQDMETTINRADCDLVLLATPIDLSRLISINKPAVRIGYEYQDHDDPTLEAVMAQKLKF